MKKITRLFILSALACLFAASCAPKTVYLADYLKEFSADTQFIVVTHRKGTMERCDTLFGVAMEERGVSSMVSVNLTDYE